MSNKGNAFFIFTLVLLVFFLAGCHSYRPPTQQLRVRILVTDFQMTDEIRSIPREVRGWWFGARDVHQNSNSGEIFADILAKELNQAVSVADVYSRTDFKYYKANKRERMKDAFPHLDDVAIAGLFAEIPPLDFARDLQTDVMLIGRLNRSYTSHNRAFHLWSSVVDADVILVNVESGEPVWSGRIALRKNFRGQPHTMRVAAEKLIIRMKKEYFDKY